MNSNAINNITGTPLEEVNKILAQPNPKEKQIKRIVKIAKYNFKWSRSTLFLYIVKRFPKLRGEIPVDLQNHYNTSALYAAMSKAQLSNIIKRLEAIERRNRKKKGIPTVKKLSILFIACIMAGAALSGCDNTLQQNTEQPKTIVSIPVPCKWDISVITFSGTDEYTCDFYGYDIHDGAKFIIWNDGDMIAIYPAEDVKAVIKR